MAKTIATLLGAGFLLLGILGFLAPSLLGLHLSTTHNLVHIITGAVALYFGLKATLGAARRFDIAFGAVYLLLGVVGFVAGTNQPSTLHNAAAAAGNDSRLLKVIPGALELGTPDHIAHILLGLIFLIGGLMTRDYVADRR